LIINQGRENKTMVTNIKEKISLKKTN